jgi:hypothetical protein
MNIENEITIGTRLLSNKMVMVVTGETVTDFVGYSEYKGENKGQCRLQKKNLVNPHLSGVQIIERSSVTMH